MKKGRRTLCAVIEKTLGRKEREIRRDLALLKLKVQEEKYDTRVTGRRRRRQLHNRCSCWTQKIKKKGERQLGDNWERALETRRDIRLLGLCLITHIMGLMIRGSEVAEPN